MEMENVLAGGVSSLFPADMTLTMGHFRSGMPTVQGYGVSRA